MTQTDKSLWPGVFGWGVLGASGLVYGGPVWTWIGVAAGSLSLILAGVQLWPGDNAPMRRQAKRAGRCRARDPRRCSSPRCPDKRRSDMNVR